MKSIIIKLTLILILIVAGTRTAFPGSTDSLLQSLSVVNSDEKRLSTLFGIANALRDSVPEQAINYYLQAYDVAEETGDHEQSVNSLLYLVEIYYSLSELKPAMEYAYKAEEIAEEHDLKTEMPVILDHMGMIYYDLGDREKCSNLYFSSLKLYEQIGQMEGVCKTLSWIGLLYYDSKNYTKAWEYYSRSLEIAKEINSQEGIASNLNNLAKVLWSRDQYRESLTYLEESLQINMRLNNSTAVASNFANIGFTHYSLREYEEALKYYEKALDLFYTVSNQVRIASTRIKLGEVYFDLHNKDKSIEYAESALNIGKQNGYKDIIYQAAKLLHKIYLSEGDTANAYRFSMIEYQWKDSLDLNAREKDLANLEIQYEFQKREQEQKIARQQRNVFVFGTIILLTLGIIITLLILNQFRLKAKKTALEKKNLELDLDFKKKEIIFNVMSLMKQNERFTELSKKILQFETRAQGPEALEILKFFGGELRKSMEKESMKEFSLRFKEINKDFYATLLEKHPNLTPNELRLCAFLRMNMTTKEISELTGQQLNALEHARYKLRQKLGISNSEVNLVTFLTQLDSADDVTRLSRSK